MEKTFSNDFKESISKDIKLSKEIKEAGGIEKLEEQFNEHNKKNPCRCKDCVLFRKIYMNS